MHESTEGNKRWHVLERLIEENGYRIFAEVGVYEGETSAYLLSKIRRPNFRVIGVDPYASPDLQKVKSKMMRTLTDYRFLFFEKFSVDAAKDFKNIDMVFIDANHKYGSVVRDIAAWWPKIREGGILSGHDYWTVKGGRNRGVRKAVNQFVYKNKLILHRETDGVWWIKKWESDHN